MDPAERGSGAVVPLRHKISLLLAQHLPATPVTSPGRNTRPPLLDRIQKRHPESSSRYVI